MAELLLLADPTDIRTRQDGESLSVDFDSIADLRSWLHLAGLDTPDLLTSHHQGTSADGREYRSMNAFPQWHGWHIYAYAIEYTDPAATLAPHVVDGLAALAAAA